VLIDGVGHQDVEQKYGLLLDVVAQLAIDVKEAHSLLRVSGICETTTVAALRVPAILIRSSRAEAAIG
jgi:hypothetical protein